VAVESSESALEYGDIAVDENSMVNADLHFDSKLMHLYVMTEKKVSKVKVQECNVYKSCWDCLNAKDPYCGWCSLENKYGNQLSYYIITLRAFLCPPINKNAPWALESPKGKEPKAIA